MTVENQKVTKGRETETITCEMIPYLQLQLLEKLNHS